LGLEGGGWGVGGGGWVGGGVWVGGGGWSAWRARRGVQKDPQKCYVRRGSKTVIFAGSRPKFRGNLEEIWRKFGGNRFFKHRFTANMKRVFSTVWTPRDPPGAPRHKFGRSSFACCRKIAKSAF